MKLDVRSTFAQIRFDQEKDAHVVVSLTAPALDETAPRPAICIIPCIDISGSMAGSKIEFAKRSVLKLIDHLRPTDYCGVVAFESSVYTVAHPVQLENGAKDRLKSEVGKLGPRGGTNFSGGLLRALELIKDLDLPEGTILRVIMFTDGQANEGVAVKAGQLVKLLEANRGRVTVSAFGYGQGADQALLTAFSTAGKGNYAFIAEPDAALSAFGTELGGLLSTYATDLVIEVAPLNGHQITEVVSDVDAEEENTGEVTIKLPDILAEEVRHLVLAVKYAEQKQAFPRPVNVFDVKVTYAIVDATGKKDKKTAEAKAKIEFVKAGDEQQKPDQALDQIVGLAQVVKVQMQAESFAMAGNYAQADACMNFAADGFRARGLMGVENLAKNVRRRVASKSLYEGSQGYLRSAAAGGTRGMGVANYDCDAMLDLQGAGVATSNSYQANTASAFSGGQPDAQAVVQPVVFGDPNANVFGNPTNTFQIPAEPPVNPLLIVPMQGNPVDLSGSAGGTSSISWSNSAGPSEGEESAKPARKPIKKTRSNTGW